MNQRIDSLTDDERAWIATHLEAARKFVDAYSPEDAEEPLTLGALDRAFAAWLDSDVTDPEQVNSAINVVGAAFGDSLVKGLGLRWVIVTDAGGSELAVHGLPGQGDVLVFPQNFVAKRWEKRETFFLVPSYKQIARHLETLTQAQSDPVEPFRGLRHRRRP
jgi:hypothetical protein